MSSAQAIRPIAVLTVTIGALILGSHSGLVAQSILLIAAAFVAYLWPPETPPRKALVWTGLGLGILTLASLLPYHWFKPIPWREALTTDLGVSLPYSLSPQPWITTEQAVLLVGSLAWFGYLHRCQWTSAQRRFLIHGLMAAFTTLALVSSVLQWREIPWPWGDHPAQFSPFANRNQLAAVCTLNAALHGGGLLVSFRKGRHTRAIALMAGLLVSFLALILIGSRAGILLAALSLPLPFAIQSIARRSAKSFVIACSVILFGFAGLFLTKTRLSERLTNPPEIAQSFQDGRLAIYRDTLTLTETQPLIGHGLGNFQTVFPFSRERSVSDYEIRHPESDWLWWWAEMGWPFPVLLILAGIILWPALPSLYRARETRPYDHGLKLGLMTGVLVMGLHSLVDVPLHRIGSLWAWLLILGLLFAKQTSPQGSYRKQRAWLPLGAALSSVVLCFLVPANAIDRSPLAWQSYFERAQETLRHAGPSSEALKDFQIARTLEPHLVELPLAEAEWWRRYDQRYILTAWHEVLKRDPRRASEHFDRFLKRAKQSPRMESTVYALTELHPKLRHLYVGHQFQTKR